VDPLSLPRLADLLGGELVGWDGADLRAEHVSIHSERIHRGSVFFALRGGRADGHRYLADAFANGAVAAVVARGQGQGTALGPRVVVGDPLGALQRLASWWRGQLGAEVVAVVGSNGKTVTKDALVHVTSGARVVYGSPGSYNSQVGVPLAVLGGPRAADLVVIEAAVSDPGEMARLESLLRPDHVVLTNLGGRWASRFADRREQAGELLSIARDVSERGWLLVGADCEELEEAGRALACRRLVVNRSPDLPRFSPARPHPGGLEVGVVFPNGVEGTLVVRTPSVEILADVETAVSAAWMLGVDAGAVLDAVGEYTPTSTRAETWRSPSGVTVVRDLVTPDPIATRSALRGAASLRGPGRRLGVVLGEDLALGPGASAAAFAGALASEGATEVYGLQVGAHRAVQAELEGTSVRVHLAPGPDALRDLLLAEARPGDVVLVQTAPTAGIGDLAVALMESMAPTRLYLDLAAVEDNVTAFRRLVGPHVRIMGMVKALAYGTDAPSISACLQAAGVDALGVAGVDEGVELRRAGVAVPILVLLPTAAELGKALRHRLTPLVYSPDLLDAVLDVDPGPGGASVHLEVDTGMHRTGFPPEEALSALRRLASAPGLCVGGVMTHLACADDPSQDAATAEQLRRFEEVCAELGRLGLSGVVRHAAATAGTLRFPESHFDMVRIGLGLYGVPPAGGLPAGVELQQAIGMVSRVVEVVEVPAGERVGYGGTFTAPAGGARVGVVPAGYHDGVPRAAGNVGAVVVAGSRCRIVGRVSMDSMAVDLSSCPGAGVGADVLVYGRHHDWVLPVEELAEACGTIAHEVMARAGPRVQRIFTRH